MTSVPPPQPAGPASPWRSPRESFTGDAEELPIPGAGDADAGRVSREGSGGSGGGVLGSQAPGSLMQLPPIRGTELADQDRRHQHSPHFHIRMVREEEEGMLFVFQVWLYHAIDGVYIESRSLHRNILTSHIVSELLSYP